MDSTDLHDFITHRRSWLSALERERDRNQGDDRSYWEHEISVFQRAFDAIAPLAVARYPNDMQLLALVLEDPHAADAWLPVQRNAAIERGRERYTAFQQHAVPQPAQRDIEDAATRERSVGG